ncbi:MAG TPA: DAK2 domain-containing protein [Gaiellaceae bacterium]|nr:DAK2 domain-containing protein [Gaiellaceae bacterium]
MPEVGPRPEGGLALSRAALAALEASRARIDDLNVYPVPDGDTGTNMTLTVRAAVDALERDPGADIGRAVLMGARGNSGVILSQLVAGALRGLPEDGPVDAAALTAMLRGASDAGYAAVRNPQEGTILTVARVLAERAEELAPSQPPVEEALAELVAAGEVALARTTEQLDVLKQAGVVDAGGAGLLEIVRGIASHVRGEELPEPAPLLEPIPFEAIHQELSAFRYCTSFFVEGDGVDPDSLEAELGKLGDSLLVVGGPGAVKAHLHTDEPGTVLNLATAVGVIAEVDVKNMHVQTAEREERILVAEETMCGAVAVCAGDGNRRLFESLGAVCVEGGQSMNPATAEIVAALDRLAAAEAVVLPNNKNVVLAAEQAVAAAARPARLVPTHSVQAGLGAMVAFDPGRPAEANRADMEAAAGGVRSGAVTRASRDAVVGDLAVEEGQYLGLVEGEPVAAGPVLQPVAREVLEQLLDEGADVLTILSGESAEGVDGLVAFVQELHPGVEVEVHEGGQPHYPLLFGAE